MVEKVEFEIEIDPIFGARRVAKVGTDAGKKAGRNFATGFSSTISRSIGSIRGQILGIGAALGAAFAFRGLLSAVKSIEQIETQLKILTGSAEAAGVVLKELQDFAATTPFQLEGIARAASQLISFGFSAATVVDRLKELGDVAAGSNSDLQDVARVFGQVSLAGKLTGERFLQLTDRAIPIGTAIANTMDIATTEVQKFISDGKVGFKEFETAFKSLSAEGGLFAGALEAQSKTVGGVLSTLSDNFFNLQTALGKAFGPAIINSANEFIKIFQGFSTRVVANGPVLVRTFSKLAEIFLIEPAKFWSSLFAGDGARSLKEVNTEITQLETKVGNIQKRIEATKDSTLANIFGGARQAQQDLGDTLASLTELKKLRKELLDAQGKNTDAIKAELDEKAKLKQSQEEENARIANQLKLRQQLGAVGLTELQQLQEKFNKEQELLALSLEGKAITEEEFQERSLESQRKFSAASVAIKEKETEGITNAVKRLRANLSTQLRSGVVNLVAQSMQLIGRSLVQGGKFFDNLVGVILDALGTIAINMGTTIVAAAKAIIALKSTLSGLPGGAAIAAGLALIIVGGALKALSSQFGGGAGAGDVALPGGGAGATGGGGVAADGADEDIVGQAEDREAPSTQVAVNINGDVLDSDETGLRLVEILNNAFDKEGVVINAGAVG